MRLRSRRHQPPVERILIRSRNPAEEIETLSGLMHGLNETVQSLWDTVHQLRQELDGVMRTGHAVDLFDQRPPTWQTPPAGATAATQIEMLKRQVDELTGDAAYLWSEAQWLCAQLAVSRDDGTR